mmetsp:Transcript_27934/g.41243  ORF Transcript_27934/g.41243 Transcript_27934/m.41243 type:complete len:599 (-) Transcript_27934:7-1803(-)
MMSNSNNATEANASSTTAEHYLNRRVAKRFGETGIFFGTVVEFDTEHELYMIRYDDNDQEDFDSSQLKRALRLYKRKQEDAKTASNQAADVSEIKQETVEETTGSRSTPASKICDVCQYKDGHADLVLIQCTQCQVAVHRECYGLPSYQGKDFLCWACQAVGKSIPTNDDKVVTVMERPTRCELCNIAEGGVHAMHPLYDNYGSKARQIYLSGENDQEDRLAWAHSLCAFLLARHNLMYGVQANGTTHEQVQEDIGDNRSKNEHLQEIDEDIEDDGAEVWGGYAPMHHFVYYVKHPWNDLTADNFTLRNDSRNSLRAIKFIKESQTELQCSICKSNDKSLGFAVQCSANMKSEFKQFRGTHQDSLPGESKCTMAVHVGCAQWRKEVAKENDKLPTSDATATTIKKNINAPSCNDGDDDPATELRSTDTMGLSAASTITANDDTDTKSSSCCKQVYFFPGSLSENAHWKDPIYTLYCDVHAKDVTKKHKKIMEHNDQEKRRLELKKRKRAMKKKGIGGGIYEDEPKAKKLQGKLSRFKQQVTQDIVTKVIQLELVEERKAQLSKIKKSWRQKFENDGFSSEAFKTAWAQCKTDAINNDS